MNFRKRAARDDVFAGGDELDAGLVVVAAHVFGISSVEHEQHMRGKTPMQPLDFVKRHVRASGIVRIGEKNNLGAPAHGSEHGIDIGRVVLFRRHDRRRARTARGDRINKESMGGVDGLVAIVQIGVSNEVQELIGAGAADNAIRIEPKGTADRFTQRGGIAIGVVLQVLADGVIGGDRLGARPERRFI